MDWIAGIANCINVFGELRGDSYCTYAWDVLESQVKCNVKYCIECEMNISFHKKKMELLNVNATVSRAY